MANLNRSEAPASAHVRSANDRWKAHWESWLGRSIVAAAIAHAVVLIIWPVWDVTRLRDDPDLVEFIQINPIAGYGGATDLGDGVVATLPTEEEVQLALEEEGRLTSEEELAEVDGVQLPLAAYAIVPEIIADAAGMETGTRTGSPLNLDRLAAFSPTVTDLTPEIGWPQIRNPTVITRFLRSRFNELHRSFGASGNVRVAMWIDERGDVEWARVSESSGDDRLDVIALTLFENIAAFAPARSRGRGVPVQVTISVPFTLPW